MQFLYELMHIFTTGVTENTQVCYGVLSCKIREILLSWETRYLCFFWFKPRVWQKQVFAGWQKPALALSDVRCTYLAKPCHRGLLTIVGHMLQWDELWQRHHLNVLALDLECHWYSFEDHAPRYLACHIVTMIWWCWQDPVVSQVALEFRRITIRCGR